MHTVAFTPVLPVCRAPCRERSLSVACRSRWGCVRPNGTRVRKEAARRVMEPRAELRVSTAPRELCVLVGVEVTKRTSLRGETRLFSMADSLAELERLADTAGMEVTGVVTQTVSSPAPGTYIGSGKLRELQGELAATGACTAVFDVELSPAQQRTLERALGDINNAVKVLDRTAVILDIFAQRASSREGQLQVELALYQYRQTRLTRLWTHLERQARGASAGAVGLRGPGETQIEVDRRAISARIARLRRDIVVVRSHRERQRAARRANAPFPAVALVGYTNAGKSTLLNALTGSRDCAYVEDRLFATLDPKTRRAFMPGVKLSPEILVTDTVGFVQNLPTQLVAAFRATLEEVASADALVHVVDASVGGEVATAQMRAVAVVLREIDAHEKPTVIVLNKVDAIENDEALDEVRKAVEHVADGCDIVECAAREGRGVADLGLLLDDVLRDVFVSIRCTLPYERGDLVSAVYEQGSVDSEEFRGNGTRLEACVPRTLAKRLAQYRDSNEEDVDADLVGTEREFSDAYWTRLARNRQ